MSALQADIADIYEIDCLQQGIAVFTRGRQAASELFRSLVQVTGITLSQALSSQHVSNERGMGCFGESARLAQLPIGLLRLTEPPVSHCTEHVSLDRKVPPRGNGNIVAREQREHLPRVAPSEQDLRLEQTKFQSPNRRAPGARRGEFLASLFRSCMSDIQAAVQIVIVDTLKYSAWLRARGGVASRQTPG